ncbi:MAG: lipid-A-disaccharide synthase [Chloroflexota bacterium]
MDKNILKVFISAGDPSGDLHASRLMRELLKSAPAASFTGLGGEEMISLGLKALAAPERLHVVGFWEVLKRIKFFKSLLDACKRRLEEERPDVFIAVDYPGFNMKLAAHAKSLGIPTIYYIAPQLWAWGANRAQKLAAACDKLLVVFPFEVDFFHKAGIDATFVGHPLLDAPEFAGEFKKFGEREKVLALLPGSRLQELKLNMPVFAAAGKEFLRRRPDFQIAYAKPSRISERDFLGFLPGGERPEISNDSRELMSRAALGVVKTGTTNLEAALLGMPFAMAYKASSLTYLYGKSVVNLESISLVNILSQSKIIPEFIQKDASPANIAGFLEELAASPECYAELQERFAGIRRGLGLSGASHNAAQFILKAINYNYT